MKGVLLLLTISCWLLEASNVEARYCLEFESRYDGDGWFHYRLRTMEDPFISLIYFRQICPFDVFLNYETNTVPNNWTNYFPPSTWAGIMPDPQFPQSRIEEISFSVRSSSRFFKTQTKGFLTIHSVYFSDPYFERGEMSGFVVYPALVPCLAEEADGSAATLVSRIELLADIKIDNLICTNGNIYGVTFSWSGPSTVELQGSFNMVDWTTITRFFGDAPQTTWTTNTPLNSFGQFFRLSLVAARHLTNSPPETLVVAKAKAPDIKPDGNLEFAKGQLRCSFTSLPNQPYACDVIGTKGQVITTRQVEPIQEISTVSFDVSELNAVGFFRVRPADGVR